MRIVLLLDSPELSGGVKVVFHHASILSRRGFDVTVLARGTRPAWTHRFSVPYRNTLESLSDMRSQDLVVATYFTTVPMAEALSLGPIVHYCQGYEGSCSWLVSQYPEIETAYSRPYPAFTVTPFLADLLSKRFGKRCMVVPPAVDPAFTVDPNGMRRRNPNDPIRILVPGIFECDLKGVPTGLEAITRLRKLGFACRTIRISTFPLSDAERALLTPDEYYQDLDPTEVARVVRSLDLLLFPSHPEEGFGLPVLEACASGVPVVASRIPSMEFVQATSDSPHSPRLVPVGDAEAMANAAATVLREPEVLDRSRTDGLRIARRFSESGAETLLSQAVHWASSLPR